jgi:hypothetical protein
VHRLAKQIVERVVAGSRSAQDALLQSLLEATAAGEGVLLRLSARRLVMRLELDGHKWLFKIDSPQRSFERLRGRLRQPSLLREANHLRQLGLIHPAIPVEVHAEQLDAANGLLARRWLTGRLGNSWTAQDAAAVGEGLAQLHTLGWSDPDLSPADLLLDEAGQLVPLDLGHALLHQGRSSPAKVRLRDLVRLLGGWNEQQRSELGPAILDIYRGTLSCPPNQEVLQLAKQWRLEIIRRQSRRCLRRTRDFSPTETGCERVEDLPAGQPQRCAASDFRSAKRMFRLMYELELLELPALRVLRFGADAEGAFLELAAPAHRQATSADQETLELCLQELEQAGFVVQTPAAQMFQIQTEGAAVLADASNLQRL